MVRFCSACGHRLRVSALPPRRVRTVEIRSRLVTHIREIRRVSWLFGALLLSSLAFGMLTRAGGSAWLGLVFSGVDAAVVFSFARAFRADLAPLFRPPQLARRAWLQLVFVAAGMIAVLSGYFALLNRAGVPILRVSETLAQPDGSIGALVLVMVALPAIFEELAFRGVILTALEKVFSEREALVIQAALFSVLHLTPIAFPSHFLLGLCLGWMRLRTRSVYPSIAVHALWNGLALGYELWG
jgi:membrane protease YdiL (CAAX protease family)